MPPKNKSKSAPNQHDKRHENGLAPPGKRVTKKHSNGQLNGQPNGKPSASDPLPAQPVGLNQTLKVPRTSEVAVSADPSQEHAAATESTERDRTYSDVSLEEMGQYGETGESCQEHESIPPHVYGHGTTSKQASHVEPCGKRSSLSILLAYYPLRDAISILILLLSLPPTLVLVIQTLFASLTFVPPTVNISLSTLPNVKEMFNSSTLGYPALATILIVDLIFWVCWLPVWKPVQNIFLDLSQAVIAISLSGASASTSGPTYSIATSTLIVCIVHVLRYQAIHLTALDYLRSVIHKMNIDIPFDVPFLATNFVSTPPVERGWFYTVVRTILGIHIVSQGVTTCIRRSLVKANEQNANVPAITRSDTEAAAGVESNTRAAGIPDGAQHTPVAQLSDGRSPGPSPAQRDNRARESTSKKKRKQANQVRSQQPLWAAIASTKVTFVKEMEQRDAADDAREAARMDTNLNTTASYLANPTNRIWICEVRDSEIFFGVEVAEDAVVQSMEGPEEGAIVSAGIDKSKPFYVRVNGAAWSSTRIMSASAPGDTDVNHYDGQIFGLAPLSSYSCEIVAMSNHKILCSASIITQAAPTAEQAAATSTQPLHPSLRPQSPITTLKQSIQQAESKLAEIRGRSKRNKKDQRSAHSDIRKEITSLKSKLEGSGGSDDKQLKRLDQMRSNKDQAEEAAEKLKGEIDSLGDIPEEEIVESETKRQKWRSAADAKSEATKGHDSSKAEVDKEMNSLKTEVSQAEAKREKLATRLTQRTEELDKLEAKQKADLTAKDLRESERAKAIKARDEEERQLVDNINGFETETMQYQQKAQDAYQEIAALQSWGTQPPPYPGYSSPPTPDQVLANGSLGSPQTTNFPAFAPPGFPTPFGPPQHPMPIQHGAPRGRSSSMLSQYSGFTDNGEEYSFAPEQPRPQYTWPLRTNTNVGAFPLDDKKDSEGSGSQNSGSTSSNSPRPDARTFVPGRTPAVGTIGPPSKNKEQSTHSPGQSSAGSSAIGSGR